MIPVFNFLPLNMPIRGILGIIQTQNGYKENNMDQKPEAENPEDIMKASAEEWSKSEEPQSEPEAVGEHDRWAPPFLSAQHLHREVIGNLRLQRQARLHR